MSSYKRGFRRLLFYIEICLLLFPFCCSTVLAATPAMPVPASSGAVLMEATTSQILRESGSDRSAAPYGAVNLLIALTALRHASLTDLVTVPEDLEAAVPEEAYVIFLEEGETLTVENCIGAILFNSANDAAYTLAVGLAGSVDVFAGWMNEKAEEIGCTEAHFVTPNGLDGEDVGGVHSISAADLAKIMSYCVLRSPKAAEFLAITQMPVYSFSDAEGKGNFSCSNHNAFLQMMDGAISGKTGFTGDAGYCYVGALQSEDRTFVVALLACGWPNNKNYKWTDTRKLMEYGMAHYRYDEVWKIPELSKIPVENGVSQNGLFGKAAVEVEIKGKESPGKILVGDDDVAEEKTEIPEKLDAPVKSGTPVGQITYLLNGEKWGSCQAVVKETVRRRTFTWIAMKMCEMFYQFNF